MVRKTLVAQKRTNAQLNSHMALAGNQMGVTLVRGERFTHKPTMPPKIGSCSSPMFLSAGIKQKINVDTAQNNRARRY